MSSRARGWLLVVALLAPAVVLPLCVPLYDRADPEVGGWPFFFWFQMLLIVVAVALTTYAITKYLLKISVYIPAPLLALGACTLVSTTAWSDKGLLSVRDKYGEIPRNLLQLSPPSWPSRSSASRGSRSSSNARLRAASGCAAPSRSRRARACARAPAPSARPGTARRACAGASCRRARSCTRRRARAAAGPGCSGARARSRSSPSPSGSGSRP